MKNWVKMKEQLREKISCSYNISNNDGNSRWWVHNERAYVTSPAAQDGAGERRRGTHLALSRVAGTGYDAERPRRTIQANRDHGTNFDL